MGAAAWWGSRISAAVAVASMVGVACGGKVGVATNTCSTDGTCTCGGRSVGTLQCVNGSYGACMCEGSTTDVSPPSTGSLPPPPSDPPKPSVDAGAPDDVSGCVGSENVLVLNGDPGDWIHPGYERIVGASWQTVQAEDHSFVAFDLEPGPGHKFLWWTPRVKAPAGGGALAVGTYLDAARAAFADGKPGLEITGDGRGCNTLSGTFWIHELEWSGNKVARVLLAFEQHCERGPSALRGCLAYTAPASDAGAGP